MGLVLLDEEDRSRVAKGSAMGLLLEQEERKMAGTPGEDRRVYSPVTFQDIARRSIGNSPVKVLGVSKGKKLPETENSYQNLGTFYANLITRHTLKRV